jgi:outer membrane lipoprotein carrier protein
MAHRFLTVFPLAGFLMLAACGGGSDEAGAPVGGEPPVAVAPGPGEAGDAPASPPAAEAPVTAPGSQPEGASGEALAPGPTAPSPPATGGAPSVSSPSPAPVTPAAPASSASDPNAILERAERAYAQVRSMEADFVQQVFVPLLDSTVHSRGRIFVRQPDRLLMRFSDPEGDLVVADGRHITTYYPSTDERQAMRTTLAEGGQQFDLHREFLSDASRRYAATLTGSESVGGRATDAITLVPRGPSAYQRVRIWVDRQDSFVRRFEIVEENGSIRNLELRNLRTNVTLSDDLFRWSPPPGVQIYEP